MEINAIHDFLTKPEFVNQITFTPEIFRPIANIVLNRIGIDASRYPHSDINLKNDMLQMAYRYLQNVDDDYDEYKIGSMCVRLFCMVTYLREMAKDVSPEQLEEIAPNTILMAAKVDVKKVDDGYFFDSDEMPIPESLHGKLIHEKNPTTSKFDGPPWKPEAVNQITFDPDLFLKAAEPLSGYAKELSGERQDANLENLIIYSENFFSTNHIVFTKDETIALTVRLFCTLSALKNFAEILPRILFVSYIRYIISAGANSDVYIMDKPTDYCFVYESYNKNYTELFLKNNIFMPLGTLPTLH
jgi:hypothetical protein